MIVYTNFSHSVQDNGDGTFDVLRGDQGTYQGTFETREDAERAANALEEDGEPNPGRRRWSVRNGTTGSGRGLFEVYAASMEEARASVIESAEESGDIFLRALAAKGFTVHAEAQTAYAFQSLSANKWAERLPAPDFPRKPAHA